MAVLTTDEMVSSTDIMRRFPKILAQLRGHELEKVFVMRNNKPEAVFISIERYEEMMEYLEELEIAMIVKERDVPGRERVAFDDILKKEGLAREDLQD